MTNIQTKIDTFISGYPQESFAPNALILTSGIETAYFYYVVRGAVKMVTTSVKGRNLILHTFFPKSFFSLFSLISKGTNNYDFVAQLPTVVRRIPQSDLIAFYKSDPDVLFDLQLRLMKGLSGLTKRIEQSTLSTAYQQVAGLLVYFAEHFTQLPDQHSLKPSSAHKLVVKITHQEMSEWLGLSRENVSIQMKQLEKNGLITIARRLIKINNLQSLKHELVVRDNM